MNLNQVTVPAIDIQASIAFYIALGLQLIVRAPHYARFKCPEGDSTFSVHLVDLPNRSPGAVVYFETSNLDEEVRRLQAEGIRFTQEPRDEPWLWREARLFDPAGNAICLYRAGTNRVAPPWKLC